MLLLFILLTLELLLIIEDDGLTGTEISSSELLSINSMTLGFDGFVTIALLEPS